MMGCKPCHFPIEQNNGFTHDMDGDLVDATVYRRLIVTVDIPYTITRPDIAYAGCVVSQFMEKPRKEHLDAVYRRYIKIKSRASDSTFQFQITGYR